MKAYAKSDVKSLIKTKNSGTDKQSGKNKRKIKKEPSCLNFEKWALVHFDIW